MNTLHLVVTTLCDRNCVYCCNNKYDIANLDYATDEDFKWADMLCLTGGEPFEYTNPCNLARYYREKYPNLKAILVYTNAQELWDYIRCGGQLYTIDGLNISIKDDADLDCFERHLTKDEEILELSMNRVYDFTCKVDPIKYKVFNVITRKWQKDFIPAENCRFKRGN